VMDSIVAVNWANQGAWTTVTCRGRTEASV
jgi:hypothetical protein